MREHGFTVRRGFVTPVHDSYAKEGLISIAHRSRMLSLALESSDWLEVSLWESQQASWTPTLEVLQHHKVCMNLIMQCTKSEISRIHFVLMFMLGYFYGPTKFELIIKQRYN